jgi:NADH dehydrogenase
LSVVTVWGARGFVGRHAVQALHAAGLQIRALTRPGRDTGELFPVGVDVRHAEYASPETDLARALEGTDVAVNCTGDAEAPPAELNQYADAAGKFAAIACNSGARRVLHLSSVAVYGAQGAVRVDTATPLHPRTPYGESRARAESLVRAAAGDRAVILRVPMVIGAGMRSNAIGRVLSLTPGGWLPHPGPATAVLPCIGVTRLAAAIAKLATAPAPPALLQLADNPTWTTLAGRALARRGQMLRRVRVPMSPAWLALRVAFGTRAAAGLYWLASETQYADESAAVFDDALDSPATLDDFDRYCKALAGRETP